MTFYIFLLVIVSLTCGSAPGMADPSWRSVAASALMVFAWGLLAHTSARMMSIQMTKGKLAFEDVSRYMHIQMEAFRWLALPVVVLSLCGFSLAAWAREQPVLQSYSTLQAIVLLLPGMGILFSTWSAEYYFQARIGWSPASPRRYLAAMGDSFRCGPAWLIGPTLILLGLSDLATWAQQSPLLLNTYVSPATLAAIVLLGGGAIVLLGLPWIIKRLFKTTPISDRDATEINGWLRGCGLRAGKIFGMQLARWDTGGRLLNAMVAGILPMGRLLVISDRLLDELPRGQRLMVVMHEVAHAKRWHVPLRMMAILPSWFVSVWVGDLLAEYSWASTAGGMSGLIVTITTLALVSHWSELDADRNACRLASRATEGDIDEAMAAELLASALVRVTAGHASSRKTSWLHPSLNTRLSRLAAVSGKGDSSSEFGPGVQAGAGESEFDDFSSKTHPLPDHSAGVHTLSDAQTLSV